MQAPSQQVLWAWSHWGAMRISRRTENAACLGKSWFVHIRERLRPQNLRAPSLDWLNFLIADVRGGLGPYVVVFLIAEQGWNPTMAGVVGTVGGWLGLAAQTPIGAWLDRADRKRAAMLWGLLGLSAGAVVIACLPSFWPVLLADGAMQVASGVFEPAVAALTVGLCTREVLTDRSLRPGSPSAAANPASASRDGARPCPGDGAQLPRPASARHCGIA
jgi:hypothetical protein